MNLQIDNNIVEKLCRTHNLRLLILHGSFAKGNKTAKSDIDIGILSKIKLSMNEQLDLISDFSEIFGDKFDPVFLNGAEPLISYQVALHGKPLFEEKKGGFQHFQVHAVSRYMDSKKFRILEKLYLKRAIGKT
jgi:predicted nucleotidyltransferase